MCGAFVVVQAQTAPTVAIIGLNIVDDVIADGRAVGSTKGVHAAHVAHDAPANMVDMVEVDGVVAVEGRAVSPSPPRRNPTVEEVGNLVVGDLVVGCLADPDAHTGGENPATGADDVVVHHDTGSVLGRVGPDRGLTDANTAGAQVVQVGALKAAIRAALAEPDACDARVRDLAVFEGYTPGAVQHDRGGNRCSRLAIREAVGWHGVPGVAEGDAAQGDMLDGNPRDGVSGE